MRRRAYSPPAGLLPTSTGMPFRCRIVLRTTAFIRYYMVHTKDERRRRRRRVQSFRPTTTTIPAFCCAREPLPRRSHSFAGTIVLTLRPFSLSRPLYIIIYKCVLFLLLLYRWPVAVFRVRRKANVWNMIPTYTQVGHAPLCRRRRAVVETTIGLSVVLSHYNGRRNIITVRSTVCVSAHVYGPNVFKFIFNKRCLFGRGRMLRVKQKRQIPFVVKCLLNNTCDK